MNRIFTFLIQTAYLKAAIFRSLVVILMSNKKTNFSIGLTVSLTIMGAMFFSSITASAFSQANTTASNGSTNTTTATGSNNATLYASTNTTTAGLNGNWSNSTSPSNPTLDQSQ